MIVMSHRWDHTICQCQIAWTNAEYSFVLQSEDLKLAEEVIVQSIQGEKFTQEVEYLRNRRGKSSALITQINLILDDQQSLCMRTDQSVLIFVKEQKFLYYCRSPQSCDTNSREDASYILSLLGQL